MKYEILWSNDINTLVDLVNKYVSSGWQIAGGLCVHNGFLCQAVFFKGD